MTGFTLKAGRERSILKGHPWVFSGALAEASVNCAAGETVEVSAADGTALGIGWYSPESQIRIRMLPATPVAELVRRSIARRAGLLAGDRTDAVRLINAENDLLPGVTVDYYAGFAVAQLTSAGADAHRMEIASAIMAALPECRGVSERTDLKDRVKEGLQSSENPAAGETPVWRNLIGEEPPAQIVIREAKCRFYVDVRAGHKTGFYLDQRDARMSLSEHVAGAEVLNCFCYTGGFGLFARAGGAKKVLQVDVSADALELARRNEELTFGDVAMDYIRADVFDFLRRCRDSGRTFDVIVLDPPKFAAVKSQLEKAARGYKDINLLAMKLLRPGGLLATFSCSGAMNAEFFDQVLASAAADSGGNFQIVARTRQAADHPALLSFPEGAYLKGVFLRKL